MFTCDIYFVCSIYKMLNQLILTQILSNRLSSCLDNSSCCGHGSSSRRTWGCYDATLLPMINCINQKQQSRNYSECLVLKQCNGITYLVKIHLRLFSDMNFAFLNELLARSLGPKKLNLPSVNINWRTT